MFVLAEHGGGSLSYLAEAQRCLIRWRPETAWQDGTVTVALASIAVGDATGGSALDRPVLEGYTIGSG